VVLRRKAPKFRKANDDININGVCYCKRLAQNAKEWQPRDPSNLTYQQDPFIA
jgi:hypothetical protein